MNVETGGGASHHASRRESPRLTMPGAPRGLVVLRHYDRRWLRPDLLAGVTVAAYLIPQCMAYAQIAGVPATTGLVAFMAAALGYSLFGSSRRLSVGPESTTALMTATVITALGVTPENVVAFAAALALVVGGVCLLAAVLRLGFLASLLSKPVLVGYMAGVAVLMIVSQFEKLTGIPTEGDTIIAEIASAVRNAGQVHWPTVVMSGTIVIALLLGQRYAPRWPNPLFAVLTATAAVAVFDLGSHGIKTVGAVPQGLPVPTLPALDVAAVTSMLVPALGIAVVAYSDNVLTARAFAEKGEHIDANAELVGLGAANIASSLVGGFPVSSSGSRTAIGSMLGARTQVHAYVCVVSVLLVMLFGGSVLAAFPLAALGALVFYAALRLIDVGEFRRIARFRTSELLLCVATTVAVLALDVLGGILAAIVLSLADLLRRVARPEDGILGYVPGLAGMHDIEDWPQARQVPGLVVYRYDSPLFFANAEDFVARATAAVDDAPTPADWLVVNTEANTEVDLTSLDALEELREGMAARGVTMGLARVKQPLLEELRAAGLADRFGEDRIFPTLPKAVGAYAAWHVAERGALPEGLDPRRLQSGT